MYENNSQMKILQPASFNETTYNLEDVAKAVNSLSYSAFKMSLHLNKNISPLLTYQHINKHYPMSKIKYYLAIAELKIKGWL